MVGVVMIVSCSMGVNRPSVSWRRPPVEVAHAITPYGVEADWRGAQSARLVVRRAGHMTGPITVAATAADPTVGDEDLGARGRYRHSGRRRRTDHQPGWRGQRPAVSAVLTYQLITYWLPVMPVSWNPLRQWAYV
jgi:hypothetical protein